MRDSSVEWNARREDTKQINACRTGPFPAFVEDANEEDEPTSEPSPNLEANFPDEPLEEGIQIWATRLFPRQNTSARLLQFPSGLRRVSDRTLNPQIMKNTSRHISMTFTPHFPRTPSMNCPDPSHGITPLNSPLTPLRKVARSTRFPPPNRKN